MAQLTAWAVDLPLVRPFSSADGQLRRRRVVIVRLESGGHTGWGEAAPVPGHTSETTQTVWDQITQPRGDGALSGMAGAALAQARADLEAKQAGMPLWRMLGGTQPVWASAAIGLDDAGQPDLGRLEAAVAEGYRRAKLKITADVDPGVLAAACRLIPAGALGLDANGSLTDVDRALMAKIDAAGFAYLEQPGSSQDLNWHAELRQVLSTPLALDESAHSLAAIEAILDAGAADIINLKVGRFGTTEALEIAKRVVATNTAVRLGGLLESGIGRAHTVAVATCAPFTGSNDIAGSDRYLADDLVRPSWRLDSGRLHRPEQPGIGVAVDVETVERFATERFDGE